MTLLPFGQGSPRHARLPVAMIGDVQTMGAILSNCHIQELLAPRITGKLLNIGAGTASVQFNHERMFGVDEYHTLEPDPSMQCTFVASATDMKPVASDYYDWVMSAAVIEHVDDPWATAREHLRAVRPGGYLYLIFPFDQVMHPAPSFGDYWRFTPQGIRHLFAGAYVHEIEIWGESPTTPNGFAMLMQKPGYGIVPPVAELYYWIEFNNDEPFQLTILKSPPTYQWPVHRVKLEPMNLAMQINGARDQLFVQQRRIVTSAQVAQEFKSQYCEPLGILGCANGVSYFRRDGELLRASV